MFYFEDDNVKKIMLDGRMGLEKEGVRTTLDGIISKSMHPFDESWPLDKDYGESQVEFVTRPYSSLKDMISDMSNQTQKVSDYLLKLQPPEMLWPFSVPPRIKTEEDIIIAQFDGKERSRTEYREYVTGVYGKYHLILSGVHVNYSFSEELIEANYSLALENGFSGSLRSYKDSVYLELARKLLIYGHLLTALTAASPVVDLSYGDADFDNKLQKSSESYKKSNSSICTGKGSLRCSEYGYWNRFIPVLDYESIDKYADSIRSYIKRDMLKKCSELHYAYRIKPKGLYSLENLVDNGAGYIELRMLDVNPYEQSGLAYEDAMFIKLFLVWLMALPDIAISEQFQTQAVINHQRAAGYEPQKDSIILPEGNTEGLIANGIRIIDAMRTWFREQFSVNHQAISNSHNSLEIDNNNISGSGELSMDEIEAVLDYQSEKLLNPEKRYCYRIMKDFWPDYVESTLSRKLLQP